MSRFPSITDKEFIKKIRKINFIFYRQAKGSHEIWINLIDSRIVVIVRHSNKNIKRRTLKEILKSINISIDEFNKL